MGGGGEGVVRICVTSGILNEGNLETNNSTCLPRYDGIHSH